MCSIDKRVGADGRVTWRARHRTPSGTQRNKAFARKVDAQRFPSTVEHAKTEGAYVDPVLARITLADWAYKWLNGQAHLKPSMHERYAGILRKHIPPGEPWRNGYIESFTGRLRDECMNINLF